jgi:hypothetical protein
MALQNDRDVLRYTAEINQQLSLDLANDMGEGNFSTMLVWQPLPSFFADISAQKGGNMFADDLRGGNSILWTLAVWVYTDEADLAVAQTRMNALVAALTAHSTSLGGHNSLIYLNYADASQDPLGSYPKANFAHMKKVAAKYDPEGKFQTRFPGGFKISRVKD